MKFFSQSRIFFLGLTNREIIIVVMYLKEDIKTTLKSMPKEMFEQGYITACMRSVTTNKEVVYRPSTICKRYLIAARSQIQQKSTFDFSHLTQTINQLGRRYCNMIRTSLTTHTETRQLRAIRIDLSYFSRIYISFIFLFISFYMSISKKKRIENAKVYIY